MKVFVKFFPVIFFLMLGHSYLYANSNGNSNVLTFHAGHANFGTSIHLKATEIEEDEEDDEKANTVKKLVNPADYFSFSFNSTTGHHCYTKRSLRPDNHQYNSSLPRYIRHQVFRI